MNKLIVTINNGFPLALSAEQIQDFYVRLYFETEGDMDIATGQCPRIFLMDMERVTSYENFSNAICMSSYKHWSVSAEKNGEKNDGAYYIRFDYSGDGAPFKKDVELNFKWSCLKVSRSSAEEKQTLLRVIVKNFPGLSDEPRSAEVSFVIPPTVVSFTISDPDGEYNIVSRDDVHGGYIITRNGRVNFSWNVDSDVSCSIAMSNNKKELFCSSETSGTRQMEAYDGYYVLEAKPISTSVLPNWTSSRKAFAELTDWKRGNVQEGFPAFDRDDFLPLIFSDGNNRYVYSHPNLYAQNGESWSRRAENDRSDLAGRAAYLSGGVLRFAGSSAAPAGDERFVMRKYNMSGENWSDEEGEICASSVIACGFAESDRETYFYTVRKTGATAYLYNERCGWSGSFYIGVKDGGEILDGGMIFRVDAFYMAILWKESPNGAMFFTLYKCSDSALTKIMQTCIVSGAEHIALLLSDNHMYAVVGSDLICCDTSVFLDCFFPPFDKIKRPRLGQKKDGVYGIFDDDYAWEYTETQKNESEALNSAQADESSSAVINYIISDIRVSDPAISLSAAGKTAVIMLYGRTVEQAGYPYFDYYGGDYFDKTIIQARMREKSKTAVMIPINGTVEFDESYTPQGLAPLCGGKTPRPCAVISDKNGNRKIDVHYHPNIPDEELYSDLKDKFTVSGNKVNFDFSMPIGNRGAADWGSDIEWESELYSKMALLRAVFVIRLKINGSEDIEDIRISLIGVTEEELKEINKDRSKDCQAEYYKYEKGISIIYLPPIYICWGCFGAETMIRTAGGGEKPARSVKAGDRLKCLDGDAEVTQVVSGREEIIYRLSCGGRELSLSGSHPVLMAEGSVKRASELKAGDMIATEKGSLPLENIRAEKYNDIVYNFLFKDREKPAYILAEGIFAGDMNAQNDMYGK